MRVEPIQRRRGRPLLEERPWAKVVSDEMHLAVEFSDATGSHAVGRAHLCDQEAAVFKGQEVVGHTRFHGFGGEHKTRLLASIFTSKKKIPNF